MKKPFNKLSVQHGFSLVELLVVIAVIAVIAAIAIPNIAGITGSARVAKDQRNAQSIVSTFSAARAAGLNTSYADEAAAVAAITDPTPIVGSAANGMTVGMTIGGLGMSVADRTAAQDYIEATGAGADLQLQYAPGS